MASIIVSTKYIMILHCVKQNYEKYFNYFFLFEKIPRLKNDISTRLPDCTIRIKYTQYIIYIPTYNTGVNRRTYSSQTNNIIMHTRPDAITLCKG